MVPPRRPKDVAVPRSTEIGAARTGPTAATTNTIQISPCCIRSPQSNSVNRHEYIPVPHLVVLKMSSESPQNFRKSTGSSILPDLPYSLAVHIKCPLRRASESAKLVGVTLDLAGAPWPVRHIFFRFRFLRMTQPQAGFQISLAPCMPVGLALAGRLSARAHSSFRPGRAARHPVAVGLRCIVFSAFLRRRPLPRRAAPADRER